MWLRSLWLGLLSAALAADVERYAVDWTSVPALDDAATSLDKLPRGCSCEETGVTDSACTVFDCGCVCDLTAGQCDANCCCDSECSSDELALFVAADSCLEEGPEDSAVRTCTDIESVVTVNTKYGMVVEQVTDSALDTLLCVEVENTEALGDYYSYPSAVTDSVFIKSSVQEDYTYQTDASAAEVTASAYAPGTTLVTAFAAASGTYDGYMRLPRPGMDGACDDNNYVHFFEEQAAEPCARRVASLASDCATAFDHAPFLGDVAVGETPQTVSTDTAALLAVEVTKVYSVTLGTALAALGTAAYSAGTGVCANALLGVDYTVHHDGSGLITNVTAVVYQGDVSGSDPFAALQSFSVAFVSTHAVTGSLAAGNLMSFPRSGSPGYVAGLPLRAGRLDAAGTGLSYQQAIAERVGGLHLMGATAAGECASSEASSVPVLFEQDQRTSCSMSLTRAELEAYCAATTTVPDFFNVTEEYVAIYGNSDPVSPVEWLAISVADTTGTTFGCSNMPTGMHYEVLSANVGNVLNPQRKVLAVRVKYSTEAWEFTQPDDDDEQVVEFVNTVTFLYLSEDTIDSYTPPLPPSAITVPYDAFYPFFMSAGAPAGPSLWLVVSLCASLSALLSR